MKKKSESLSPEPAWFRAWRRIEVELKTETKADICSVMERVVRKIEGEVIEALYKRDFRAVDRLSDEFHELGRFSPMCPAIAAPVRPRLEKLLKVAEELRKNEK